MSRCVACHRPKSNTHWGLCGACQRSFDRMAKKEHGTHDHERHRLGCQESAPRGPCGEPGVIATLEGFVGVAIGIATLMLAHWAGRRRGYDRGYKIGRWDMAREIILAYEKHREPEQQVDAMDAAAWRELGVMRRPRD